VTERTRPHWADIVMACFTILIFLTYLTSDYFLWKQFQLTSRALNDNEASFTRTLGETTKQTTAQQTAADAAQKAAQTADNTLKESRASFQRTLEEMKEQTVAEKHIADNSTAELELSQRPWVDAQISLDGGLVYGINGTGVSLKIDLRNTGHSPAFATNIEALALVGSQAAGASQYRDQICQDATKQAMGNAASGIALFPNAPFTQHLEITIGKEQLEKARLENPKLNAIFYISAIVCIGYRPTFNSTSVYTTSYILDLIRRDDVTGPNIMFRIGENVDQAHLFLQLHFIRAISAN
jgi:hypothetical protein